ncbi:MAG: lytic transglycosylase domain-containing protein [Deltaproteobacteria bacterium]|nr:MAG: lytic transglycosylase domain-containing protein [Deltaproteobacteria bacterium]
MTLIFLIILVILFPATVEGKIYSYMDSRGVVHFTNVPVDRRFRVCSREISESIDFEKAAYRIEPYITKTAEKYMIEKALIKAIIKVESDFNHAAISSAGASGLMQLMPGTAEKMGVRNVFNPRENIDGGTRYLRTLLNLFRGDLNLSLAAYNAGEHAVLKYKAIPPYEQTRNFVKRVFTYLKRYRKEYKKIDKRPAYESRTAVTERLREENR